MHFIFPVLISEHRTIEKTDAKEAGIVFQLLCHQTFA
jgi:hypothetical protein